MGENVLKTALNEVQGQGTNIQTAENGIKWKHNSLNEKKLTQLTVFANHAENKTFDIVLQPMDLAMDDKTANIKKTRKIFQVIA